MNRETNKYTSHDIQNEILTLMSNQVLRKIGKTNKSAKYFFISADECIEVANNEQLTICVRWVDDELEPHEDFIGSHEIPNINAKTIVEAIKDSLVTMGLSLQDLRDQCYDGAGSMAGKKSGVAKRVHDEEPKTHYTHCHGHALA